MDPKSLRISGDFSDITISVNRVEFHLHKFPLITKSEYFKNAVENASFIELDSLDGGASTFERVADFCYGKEFDITPSNVVYLNSAAKVLSMTGPDGLIERTEKYLDRIFREAKNYNRVVPAVVVLAYASTLDNFEKNEVFTTAYNIIMELWLQPSQSPIFGARSGSPVINGTRHIMPYEPKITRYLSFVPDKLLLKILRDNFNTTSCYAPIATIVALNLQRKFKHLLHAQNSKHQQASTPEGDKNNFVSGFAANDCHLSSDDEEHESDSSLKSTASVETGDLRLLLKDIEFIGNKDALVSSMDELLSALPQEAPLKYTVSVDWCKEALQLTDSRKKGGRCRTRILEITAMLLERFSVDDFITLSPYTIIEIFEAQKAGQLIDSVFRQVNSESSCRRRNAAWENSRRQEEDGDFKDETQFTSPDADAIRFSPSLAYAIDKYLERAVRNGDLTLDLYLRILRPTLANDPRASHSGIVHTLTELVSYGKLQLTDEDRKEICSVVDLSRCSPDALEEALDADLLPVRVLAKAAIRMARAQSSSSPVHQLQPGVLQATACSPPPAPSRSPPPEKDTDQPEETETLQPEQNRTTEEPVSADRLSEPRTSPSPNRLSNPPSDFFLLHGSSREQSSSIPRRSCSRSPQHDYQCKPFLSRYSDHSLSPNGRTSLNLGGSSHVSFSPIRWARSSSRPWDRSTLYGLEVSDLPTYSPSLYSRAQCGVCSTYGLGHWDEHRGQKTREGSPQRFRHLSSSRSQAFQCSSYQHNHDDPF
ncbi:hypothetical protein SprV_0200819200 [Sparganum proliferum]